jgi:TRAP-type C4-dicarboxylate transport system permease small subunit
VGPIARALDRLLNAAALLGGAALLAMAVMISADVLRRALLGRPFTGVFEATETLLVAVIFLVLGLVEWQHRQLNVDILVIRARGRLRLAFVVLDKALTVLVLGILLWFSAAEWHKAWTGGFLRRGMVEIPTAIPLGVLVVGTALTLAAALVGLLRALACLGAGRPMAVPGAHGATLGDAAPSGPALTH